MNFKNVLTIGLSAALLTACASTPPSNEPLEMTGWKFGKDSSIAYRLAKMSGIKEVYDSEQIKDSTVSGGFGSAVFGSSLAAGGSLVGSALNGLTAGLFTPDAESSMFKYIHLSNAVTEKQATDAIFNSTLKIFSQIHNAAEKDVAIRMFNKGRSWAFTLPYENIGCKPVIHSFLEKIRNSELKQEVHDAAKLQGCKMTFGGPNVEGLVNESHLNFLDKQKTLSSVRMHLFYMNQEVLYNKIDNEDVFVYAPPSKYLVWYGSGKIIDI
jgi:hypothetical protein